MLEIISTPEFQQRFWAKVDIGEPDKCWFWQGCINNVGYGSNQVGHRKNVGAHRIAYLLSGREIPDTYVIDHLCRNRNCVNPAHLEAVTNKENILRGTGPTAENSRKTHCVHGHPLEGNNVVIRPNGTRQCRICSQAAWRNWYKRKKAAVALARNA